MSLNVDKFQKKILDCEAELGGLLFAGLKDGGKREFFCLDENTWIWYQEYSKNGLNRGQITRYDVGQNRIVKSTDGGGHRLVSHKEAEKLLKAAKIYRKEVEARIYRRLLNL